MDMWIDRLYKRYNPEHTGGGPSQEGQVPSTGDGRPRKRDLTQAQGRRVKQEIHDPSIGDAGLGQNSAHPNTWKRRPHMTSEN